MPYIPRHPFITQRDVVAACLGGHPSILSLDEADLIETVPEILRKYIYRPELARFV